MTGTATPARTAAGVPILVLFYVVALILPIELQIGPLLMSPLRLLLMLTIVPLGIGLYTGRYGKILLVDWLFLLHVGWAMAAVTVNNPARALENVGSMAVEFLGGYIIARTQIRDKRTFMAFSLALLAAVVMVLPFGIVESLTGKRTMLRMFNAVGIPTINPIPVEIRMGLARVQGPFSHPIHFGLFGSLIVTLTFLGLKERLSFFWRIVAAGTAFLVTFLSLSSGAILAVMIQGMLVAWAFVTRSVRHNWFWLFALIAAAYIAVDLASNRSPIQVFMSRATFSPHNAYYRAATNTFAWDNIMAHPIFGLGLNPWQRPSWLAGSIDNFWLVIGIRYGLPGLGLLVAGYLHGVMRLGLAKLTDPGDIFIRQAWMITFGGLIFTLTTVHVWANLYSLVFMFFGSGLWLATTPTSADSDGMADATGPERRGGRLPLRYSRFPPSSEAAPTLDASAPARVEPPATGRPTGDSQFRRLPNTGRERTVTGNRRR